MKMARRSFAALMGADPLHDNLHPFETSWFFSPMVLFCIRALISLYAFTSHFFIFGWNGSHGAETANRRSFSFFTHFSFWGVSFYYLVAAVHTILYARTGRSVLLDKLPRFLRALHSLFYTTIVVFPFIVTIIYWAMLFSGPWFDIIFDAWTNVTVHILPSVFALFEIVFTTTFPPPLLHLPFLILTLVLYLAVAYISHATQGFYPYSFLDPGPHGEKNGHVAGYCFAILGCVVAMFGIVWGLIWLRRRVVGAEQTKYVAPRRAGEDAEVGMEEAKD